MAKISKTERLLNLVSFLLKTRRPVGVGEIRDSVVGYEAEDASQATVERRFERDKVALRDLGVPLEFVNDDEPGGPGYRIPHDAYFLPHIALDPAEMTILAAAGKLAMAGTAGPVSDALTSALRKLRFDSPIPGDIRQTAEEHFLFQTADPHESAREEANLKELTASVLARRAVRFTYYTITEDRTGKRQVEPYGLGYANGHWYLVGFDHDRDDVRTYRIDRIRGDVKRLKPDANRPEFDVPDDFQIKDWVGVPPWLFKRTRRTAVRVRFDKEVAFMVRLRPAPGDIWKEETGGALVLTRYVTNSEALLNWVLGFGRRAEVLDPPELRDQVTEKLRAVRALHCGAAGKEVRHGG